MGVGGAIDMDAVRSRWIWIALIAALLVRIPAITTLPIDWDEPIYMEAAQGLNQALYAGDWEHVFDPQINPEHPGLVKSLFALGFACFGSEPSLVERLMVVRGTSLLAGLGMVVLAARVHPVAGLAIALHTIHAKYSCQGYLDSIPALFMALAMLLGWKHRDSSRYRPVIACGAMWGAAIAGKWIHGLPGIILLLVFKRWSTRFRLIAVTLICLWLFDPTGWLHPVERYGEMLGLHRAYAHTVPLSTPWEPWISLAGGGPAVWHPEVFPWSIDAMLLTLGLMGLGMSLQSPWGRFLAAWFFLPMLVFMSWDTRWPQHLMVVLMPMCLAIVEALRPLISRASHHFEPSD